MSAIEPIAVVMKPAARNGFSTNSSVARPTMPATRKAKNSDGNDRQAEIDIGHQAREGADGRMRGEREIGEAQHGEDRGEPDGRHRQNGAGHEAVEDQLQDSRRPLRR